MRRWVALAAFLGVMAVGGLAHADDNTPPRHTAGPWVVIGAGATAGVVGTVLEVVALSTARPAGPVFISVSDGGGAVAANDTKPLQGAAIITMSLGLGAVVAGLIWHYAEPTSTAHVTISPTLGGLALRATF